MAIVTLWCKGAPTTSLKLGPGDVKNGKVIVFSKGYAELDDQAPDFAERMSWVNSPGCPHIEVIDPDDPDAPRPFDPNDQACPETVLTLENLTGSRHEIRGWVPCTFRAPTTREIHRHQLSVHRNKGA
jgi:hypothetical protein